jgi:hypothetical protein
MSNTDCIFSTLGRNKDLISETMRQGGNVMKKFLYALGVLILAMIILYLLAPPVIGQDLDAVLEGFEEESPPEPGDLDEVLDGFESQGSGKPVEKEEKKSMLPEWLDISGDLILGGSYNIAHEAPKPGQADYRGLSRFQPKIRLEAEARFSPNWQAKVNGHAFYDLAYEFKGRDKFTDDVLDRYEDEAEIDEAWILGKLSSSLDLKFGRQIVVWGKSDNIRVVDVLNPLDNREPGLVDIEDLRLPVTMTKLDYYFGPWNLSGIAVHEIRFNKDPVYGSDFFPFDRRLPPEVRPDGWDKDAEFGLALKGIFSGWDVSFFWARFFDDQAHVAIAAPPLAPGLPPQLERRHSRLTMLGTSANVAHGNFLYKAEAAYFEGFEYYNLPGVRKSRFDFLLGAEYTGFTDTTVSLEAVNRHMLNYDPSIKAAPDFVEEDDFQGVFRLTRKFRHETVEVTLLASWFGWDARDGAMERISVNYDVTDNWSTTLGLAMYQYGRKPQFQNIGENDRLFFEAKYSF